NGAAELFGTGRHVERVESLEVSRRRIDYQLGHRDHVDSAVSARRRIYYRGGRYTDLGRHLAASAVVGGGLIRAEHRHMPKRRAGSVGVERVHSVILGDDIDPVVRALAGVTHIGLDERLPVNQPIDRVLEELAE